MQPSVLVHSPIGSEGVEVLRLDLILPVTADGEATVELVEAEAAAAGHEARAGRYLLAVDL